MALLVDLQHHPRDPHSLPTRRSSDLPNRDEDLSKGKRTPVTILGAHRAKVIFVGILSLPEITLARCAPRMVTGVRLPLDRKSTRLNSSHVKISYAVFCLKKKKEGRLA